MTVLIIKDWRGLKPPEICTVQSLGCIIPTDRYNRIYWIAKIVDHMIIESHPLTDWHFAADGKLCGRVDTGAWKLEVEITLDEFVVLSVA
ncbi:MAG: hypothetical protein H0X30_03765 [Anaerolineae bacterium]|nr:hypothetical protein [Anaerolineae bacterium]